MIIKWLIRLLLLIVIALAAILLVWDDPGFLLVKYRDYSVETSLALGIFAVFCGRNNYSAFIEIYSRHMAPTSVITKTVTGPAL